MVKLLNIGWLNMNVANAREREAADILYYTAETERAALAELAESLEAAKIVEAIC